MSTEGKDKGGEITGTSGNPSLDENPSTVDLSNTPLRDETSSVSRHEYNDGMSAIKAQMNEMTQLLRALMSKAPEGGNAIITPNTQTLGGGESVSQFRDDGRSGNPSIPLHGNGAGVNSVVAPPPSYNPLPLPEPHFAHAGPTPILNKDEYPIWAYRMKRHLRGSSEELWRIVQEGFHPYDRHNMTPREYRDNSINSHALVVIGNGLKPEQENLVRKCETTKECWYLLERTLMGSASIRSSKFDKVQDQADNFVRNEGESSKDVHRRLVALANDMTDHGSKDTDDDWVKRKFISAMLLYKEHLTQVIRQRPDFRDLTSNQVLDEFLAMEILDATAKTKITRHGGPKMQSLALRAKEVQFEEDVDEEDVGPEDTKYAYNEHMALASRQFWSNKKNFKSNTSSFKPKGQRIRTCFNCGNVSYFVADCPYEKREDYGGKLIRKDKSKSPLNKNFVKKKPPRAFVAQEEYFSDNEDNEEGDEIVATAIVAIAMESSPSSSLFNSPNENPHIIHKCLMAKTTTVTPPLKPFTSTNPSLLDCVEEKEEPKIQEGNEFELFISKLKGEAKRHFVALLEQLGGAHAHIEELEESITELQGHSRDYVDEIGELSHSLEEECELKLSLEEAYDSVSSKLKVDLKHANAIACDLKTKNDELMEAHERLLVDHEKVEKDHKSLQHELMILKKAHEETSIKLTKEINTFSPILMIEKPSPINPCCEHIPLIEENARLKAQLEKGLVSCIQGEKNLNDLLSSQKEVIGKEGIGYGASPSKKKNNKRKNKKKKGKAPPPSKEVTFVKEGEKPQEKVAKAIEGGMTKRSGDIPNDFAGPTNPSYVLCCTNNGHVYAKIVGSFDEYIAWSIWVPKTLVTNARGPIREWVPKTKH